jgi:GT2 family glycosyltransferase
MAKIALVMSVYKNSRLEEVKECLNSIYNQTLKPDIFVAIDGPIDKELKDFLKSQPIDLTEIKENIGIPKAHNILFKKVLKKGYDYIARMDSDDLMVKDRIKLQFEFMEKHKDVGVVGGFIKEIYDDGSTKIIKYPLTNEEMREFFKKRVPIANVTTFFRREFFESVGLYPESSPTNEDTLLWLSAFKKGVKFANIDKVLVIVRAKSDYLKRRSGIKKAFSDFKDRIKVAKELNFGLSSYLYAILVFLVNISPVFIKKLIYKLR